MSVLVPAGLTYADLCELPDDGKRHELIGGEHLVTPSPNLRHQILVGRLHLALSSAAHGEGGTLLLAPFDVVITDIDVVEPDLLYVGREHLARFTDRNLAGIPDLAIEVGSPTTRRRDERLKRDLYARSGVPEYWFVDPEIDVIKVFRLTDGGYGPPAELAAERGDVLTTPLLPSLVLELVDLFRPDRRS